MVLSPYSVATHYRDPTRPIEMNLCAVRGGWPAKSLNGVAPAPRQGRSNVEVKDAGVNMLLMIASQYSHNNEIIMLNKPMPAR